MASGGGGLSRGRESQASDNSMRGWTIRSLGADHICPKASRLSWTVYSCLYGELLSLFAILERDNETIR